MRALIKVVQREAEVLVIQRFVAYEPPCKKSVGMHTELENQRFYITIEIDVKIFLNRLKAAKGCSTIAEDATTLVIQRLIANVHAAPRKKSVDMHTELKNEC